MMILSEDQLNSLNREALIIIVASLQDQLASVQSQLDTANTQLADTNRQIELLTEQIRIMNQRHFGRQAESNLTEGQLTLFDSFNEAEMTADENASEPEITEVIIASYRRKKTIGKRDEDLDGLPARIIEHSLSEEELIRLFPDGYKELPNEVYRRLHIIPETFIVDEHHVHVYASKNNDGTIVKAPRPTDLFRNSIATPSLVASILNGKYNNAAALIADSNHYKGIDVIRFGANINEIMDREILDHISILEMYHRVLNMYKKYYQYEKIEGSLRISKEKIPEEAFREALANSLVHRLWDINARIRVSMFEDKIEITSCGGLPREISEKEYLDGQISFLRNPIIGNIFFRLNYIEMFGSGIKRINASYNNFQNKPEFKIYENSITVILPIESNLISLSEDEKAIVSILKNNLKLSRTQIEDETQFTKYKTIRILNSLIEKSVVQKTGTARNIKYILK